MPMQHPSLLFNCIFKDVAFGVSSLLELQFGVSLLPKNIHQKAWDLLWLLNTRNDEYMRSHWKSSMTGDVIVCKCGCVTRVELGDLCPLCGPFTESQKYFHHFHHITLYLWSLSSHYLVDPRYSLMLWCVRL